jgi:hypothetical protein
MSKPRGFCVPAFFLSHLQHCLDLQHPTIATVVAPLFLLRSEFFVQINGPRYIQPFDNRLEKGVTAVYEKNRLRNLSDSLVVCLSFFLRNPPASPCANQQPSARPSLHYLSLCLLGELPSLYAMSAETGLDCAISQLSGTSQSLHVGNQLEG